MRSDDERLRDIAEAIERIERYTSSGRAAFDSDELVQNWVVHHLQIIGEAANRVSDEWRDAPRGSSARHDGLYIRYCHPLRPQAAR